jgi:hypothetical protein
MMWRAHSGHVLSRSTKAPSGVLRRSVSTPRLSIE